MNPKRPCPNPATLAPSPKPPSPSPSPLTLQGLDDLQAVGQVGAGAARGAAGAAVGVVGAGGAGGQAVVGGEEPAGALALPLLLIPLLIPLPLPSPGTSAPVARRQGPEFPLAIHVEEGPLRGVVLLPGGQAAQGRLQVLAPRGARLPQALGPLSSTAGGGGGGGGRLVG